MRDYFDAEMRLLHEAAREFAEAYPEQARMLSLSEVTDRDPYVERLLEGMAFLTAHVRERIDESRSAISEQLLAQVCPAQIRPYPSATVMQVRLQDWRQAVQEVAAGALVYSRSVGDSDLRCPFALTRGVRLHPQELRDATAEETDAGGTLLRVELRAHGTTPVARMGVSELDFFLHADRALAMGLYGLLTDPATRLRIRAPARGQPVDVTGTLRFVPLGLDDAGAVLPWPQSGQLGLDLLQDYFCFRDRYLFLRLRGLDGTRLDDIEDRFWLEVEGPVPLPAGHQLGAKHLRLFCVPAVNLYGTDSEPVDFDHRRTEYRLVADASHPNEVSVYSVDSVTARGQRSGAITELWPQHRLRPGESRRYFHDTRHGHGTATQHIYLQVGGGAHLEAETLSARVQACNGHLPRRHLTEGEIATPSEELPSSLRIANLTRPGPYHQPPVPAEYPTRLHGFLTASVGSLADVETLIRLLHLMDWSGRADNRRRIEAIEALEVHPVNRLQGGMLHRGLEFQARIDEECFLSVADIRLFGDVLHAFLASVAAVNEFVSLRIVTQPTQRELSWQPRTGRSSPL